MTNDFISGIMALIRCALTKAPISLPENFDWKIAYTLACEHQIAALIYYGIQISKCRVPEKLFRLFRQSMIQSAMLDEMQTREINQIQQSFQEQAIDFMTLKGIDIKPLYPDRALRVMSDIDILIRTEQYESIIPVMKSFGYAQEAENDHVYLWNKSNIVIVELHKRLVPQYFMEYNMNYGDGWDLSHLIKPGNTKYALQTEDEFIYLFTHLTKHYKDGCAGLKHLVDLFLFQNANTNMDFSYIRCELSKMQLLKFYMNINHVLNVWFADQVLDDVTDYITRRFFENGTQGSESVKSVASAFKLSKSKNSSRGKARRAAVEVIFLPYKMMRIQYPILKKIPFLLPALWLVRILNTLLFHRNKIAVQFKRLKNITPSAIDQYQQELNYVGLNFIYTE